MTAGARLRVDPIACDGRGLCAEVDAGTGRLTVWGGRAQILGEFHHLGHQLDTSAGSRDLVPPGPIGAGC